MTSTKDVEAERIRLLQELNRPDPELEAAEKELRAIEERISGIVKATHESRLRSAKLEKEIEVLEKKRVEQAETRVLLEEKGKKLEEELGPLRDRAATADRYKKDYERMVGLCQSAQKKLKVVEKDGQTLLQSVKNSHADSLKKTQKIAELQARKNQLLLNEKNWKKYLPLLFALLDEVDALVPINEETKKMKTDVAALSDSGLRERLIGTSSEHEAMARQVEMLINSGLKKASGEHTRAKSAKTVKIAREEMNAEMKPEKFAKKEENRTEDEKMSNGAATSRREKRGKSVATTKVAEEEVKAEKKRKYAEKEGKKPEMTLEEKMAWFQEEKKKIEERAARKDAKSLMTMNFAELDIAETAEKDATAVCQDDEPMPLQSDE